MAGDVVGVWIGCRDRARREYRNPRLCADGALRPDDDLAAAREPHARVVAHHRAVHRDDLLAIAVRADCGHASRWFAGGEGTHPDPLRALATRVDGAPDRDRDAPGVHRTLMMGHNAVAVSARRGDGVVIPGVDCDVSVPLMTRIQTVGKHALRRDATAPGVDCDVADASVSSVDAMGESI